MADEEEEEKKSTQSIPVAKTNMKEGRSAANYKVVKNTLSIQDYKNNEFMFLNDRYQTNDPQKIANAIVLEINFIAGQLFEMSNNFSKLILYKPKKIFKQLLDDYQKRLEEKYGENILRHVI